MTTCFTARLAAALLPLSLGLIACDGSQHQLPSAPGFPRFSVLTDVSVTDLGTLPGGTFSQAVDINGAGQIAGFATTQGDVRASMHAVLWTPNDGIRDLGTLPDGTHSFAFAVNDFAQVVGQSTGTAGSHAFLWSSDSGMRDLGGLTSGGASVAYGIDDAGQVVGSALASSGEYHAFVWTAASGMQDLGTLGGDFSRLDWINNLGQAAGTSRVIPNSFDPHRAVIWSTVTGLVSLGALNDGPRSEAARVNSLGEAVGGSSVDPTSVTPIHPFLWTAASGMTDLGTLGWAGFAESINDLEQIVGNSEAFEGAGLDHTLPFLWTAEGGMVQLPTLGGSSGFAYDISDRGIVVGESRTTSGEDHAAIWTLTLTPPAPVEQIGYVASAVRNAVSAGALPAGPADGLLAKLDAATRLVDRGNVQGATDVLEAFINQIQALILAGSLSVDQAQPVIDAARRAIADLTA